MIRKIPFWGTGPYGSFGNGAPAFLLRIAGFSNKKAATKRRFLPFLVNPRGMTQQEWSDAFVYAMSPTLPLPQYTGDFQSWAAQVAQEPQLQGFQLPVSAQSWEEWADAVNASLTPGAM